MRNDNIQASQVAVDKNGFYYRKAAGNLGVLNQKHPHKTKTTPRPLRLRLLELERLGGGLVLLGFLGFEPGFLLREYIARLPPVDVC